jgi:hypothetical protein
VNGDLTWLWHALQFLMTNPFEFAAPRFALLLFFAGAIFLVVRRGGGALIVLAPFIASIVLSLVGKYPLHERLSLYLEPCVFLAMAALVDLRDRGRHLIVGLIVASVALAAIVVVGTRPAARAISVAWKPTDITDSRGPFAFVAAHWQPGDALYIESPWAGPAYHYYGPRYHVTANGSFGISTGPCAVDPQLHVLRAYRRVWFVLAHRGGREPPDRNTIYRSYLAGVGTPVAAFSGDGQSGAYLYDIRHVHSTVTGLPTWIPDGCLSFGGL